MCPLNKVILLLTMVSFFRNLSVTYANNSLVPNTCSSQSFYHFVTPLDYTLSPNLVYVSSSREGQLRRLFHCNTHSNKASNFLESRNQFNSSYLERESTAKETDSDNFFIEQRSDKDKNEMERRMKIGLANRGRVPWNKGKKHTAGKESFSK